MSYIKKSLLAFALCVAAIFTACSSEDITGGLNKLESFSYLHNESGKKVTLTYYKNNAEQAKWTLNASDSLEIFDTDRWSMTNIPDGGKVVFEFEDGTEYEHTCELGDGSSTDYHKEYIFSPKENNILDYNALAATDEDQGSWTRTTMKGNKVRYDYYIK